MAIQESGEMYLENIYLLKKQMDNVRSIDIANFAKYSKPSVSRAMSVLKKEGYIVIDENGYIELTETGLERATTIYERHVILTKLFKGLGVSEEVAIQDACKIEHHISEESFTKIKEHIDKFVNK